MTPDLATLLDLGQNFNNATRRSMSRKDEQTKIVLVPLTTPKANEYVLRWHRHHAPLPGGFAWFCVGAVAEGRIVGVAIAGRPTNRNNDDGQTVEVLRVATDGTPNACSALLGACARAAGAIGAARIITYTLSVETGASLRGAGWAFEAETGRSWWNTGKSRTRAVSRPHMEVPKHRWARHFREPIEVVPEQHSPECDLDEDCSAPCLFASR